MTKDREDFSKLNAKQLRYSIEVMLDNIRLSAKGLTQVEQVISHFMSSLPSNNNIDQLRTITVNLLPIVRDLMGQHTEKSGKAYDSSRLFYTKAEQRPLVAQLCKALNLKEPTVTENHTKEVANKVGKGGGKGQS